MMSNMGYTNDGLSFVATYSSFPRYTWDRDRAGSVKSMGRRKDVGTPCQE